MDGKGSIFWTEPAVADKTLRQEQLQVGLFGKTRASDLIAIFHNQGETMARWVLVTVCSLVLLAPDVADCQPQTKSATLVEIRAIPKCYSLDCPPWPMPDDVYACFQVEETYYVGGYIPWGVPWATAGKRLLALRGQSVQIVLTEKEINVVTQKVKVRLKRISDFRIFTIPSCNQS